jgi:hypothetical protein
MRFPSLKIIGLLAFIILITGSACSDEKEQFETEALTDYTPTLTSGKYITYRVDSLVFPNFGRNTEVHKYQQKHVIDALITDNLGRPSYRVFRYIRDSVDASSWTSAQAWVPNGSYLITVLNDQVEVIEDNLRFIKLHLPIREGFTWRGNTHLPSDPYMTLFGLFSNDDNMADWEFYYDQFETAFAYRNQLYTDVWTIEAIDESYNVPIVDVGAYGARSRAMEKYAKGIGLVYREYALWEYQPNPGGTGGPYKTGFGITQWMIDHN